MKTRILKRVMAYILCMLMVLGQIAVPVSAADTLNNEAAVTDNVVGTIYFNKAISWGWNSSPYTPSVYIYFNYNGSTQKLTGAWPGTSMTLVGEGSQSLTDVENKVYYIDITEEMFENCGVDPDTVDIDSLGMKVIFNDGKSSKQTGNIDFEGFGKIYNITDNVTTNKTTNGIWTDFDADTLGTENTTAVKNVIFMIGDGMGENHIKAGELYKGETLNIQTIDNVTYVKTNSTSDVTDSAAAATALATGNKTNNSVVGLDKNGNSVENITETAISQNLKTGLVVTQVLPHATPAGFSAHVSTRYDYYGIAQQQIASGIDVMFGGGSNYFSGYQTQMADQYYTWVTDFDSLEDVPDNAKVIGTFASEGLRADGVGDVPSLADMTSESLERLENDNGFFLMVEGSDIDTYSHQGNMEKMLAEMVKFDDAIEVAMDYVDEHPDTLLIITADHETGGLFLDGVDSADDLTNSLFTSSGSSTSRNHTAAFVQVYAYGAGAEGLTSADLIDNTDIYEYIKDGITKYTEEEGRDAADNSGDESLNIPEADFEKDSNIYYGNATLYDYYSDYELSGFKRSDLTSGNSSLGSLFKQQGTTLNKAISDYFEESDIYPLYFGDFYDYRYNTSLLSLKNFSYYINNSASVQSGTTRYDAAIQGLVDSSLNDDGELTMGGIVAPYFSEAFLRGENSKNVSLGYVFEDVEFPFILNNEGYWEYNSHDSSQSLRLKQTEDGEYFLDRTGEAVKGYAEGEATKDANFLPFNDSEQSGNANQLNYMFGTKLEIPFYLTEDGTVLDVEGNEQPILFNFSGDDDIWIFIDGELVLDMGGDHGVVAGQIDFSSMKAAVSGTKNEDGTIVDVDTADNFIKETKNGITSSVEEKYTTTDFTVEDKTGQQHTLTMYYMERGLWESNMKITFNFQERNELSVSKDVVIPDEVNSVFEDVLAKLLDDDYKFIIKNLVTSGQGVDDYSDWNQSVVFNEIDTSYTDSIASNDYVTAEMKELETEGHEEVLSLKFTHEKQYWEDQSVTDKLCATIKPVDAEGNVLESIDLSDFKYITFDTYYNGSLGDTSSDPFIALTDADGTRIGAWSSSLLADNEDNNMANHSWKEIKADLTKMDDVDDMADFDFENVTSISIAYWNDIEIYVDNIKFLPDETNKAPINSNANIDDYGSAESKELEAVNGAEYVVDDTEEKTVAEDGSILLQDGQTAKFVNQFRDGSYIYIEEEVNSGIFNTKWTIYENGVEVKSASGTIIDDDRTAAVEENLGITQPENAIVYSGYENPDAIGEQINLEIKYTNTLRLGSITVKKDLENGTDSEQEYSFKIVYRNIAGMNLEEGTDKEYSEIFTLKAGEIYVIEGVPVGTEYAIYELQNGDDTILTDITENGEHEDVELTVSEGFAKGTVCEGNHEFTFVNKVVDNQNPSDSTDLPTGDSANVLLLVMLMAASMTAMAFVSIRMRKKSID